MANISPQADAGDPLIVGIDMDPLPEAQVPDVLGQRVWAEWHPQAVVGEKVA
jgi:hypothetical protein